MLIPLKTSSKSTGSCVYNILCFPTVCVNRRFWGVFSFCLCSVLSGFNSPLVKHLVSCITFPCCSTELPIITLVGSRVCPACSVENMHDRILSCSTVAALRPQRHQHNEKWCPLPIIWSTRGKQCATSPEWERQWRCWRLQFKKSQNWYCYDCSYLSRATMAQLNINVIELDWNKWMNIYTWKCKPGKQ